jgi:predicted nucleic acid-binding protein
VSLVLHSSIVIAWYFDNVATAEADAVLDRVADGGAIVPTHWRLDIGEAFQKTIQRNRTDAIYRGASIAELALMPITIDGDTDTYAWSATLHIAERFLVPLHEASYLELAHRRGLPVATLSADLEKAAKQLGVPIVPAALSL